MLEIDHCMDGSNLRWTGLAAVVMSVVMVAACADATSTDGDESRQQLPDSTSTQAIKGGEVDSNNTAVVGMLVQRGRGAGICTGTLIAKNLVLTARHCVSHLSSDRGIRCGQTTFTGEVAARDISVTTETRMNRSSNFMNVDKIHIPPGGDGVCGNDIAMLRLASNVSSSKATPRRPRLQTNINSTTTYTAIGYGKTDQYARNSAGTRRILKGQSVQCVGSSCYGGQTQNSEFVGSGGTCQGDSGGGAYDSKGRVVGALSRGGGNCASSLYSGVYEWRDWIRRIGGQAASKGGYPAPGWSNSGPDADDDGISDDYDNCTQTPNPNQKDIDDDGDGDACDDDSDADGVDDENDNCEKISNPQQDDADGDGVGDACDDDSDNDGVEDTFDNCPEVANPDQTISNANGKGDACDPDDDGDGVEDDKDNCPMKVNSDQKDADDDGIGDVCDEKPNESPEEDEEDDGSNDGETDDGDNTGSNDGDNTGASDGSDDSSDSVEEPILLEPEGNDHACSASATGSTRPADLAGSMLLGLLVFGASRIRRLRRD